MTKQQFDDLYLGKVVHCDTEEKSNEFLKLAHGFGWNWCNGRSLLAKNDYHDFQEKTCYNVNDYGFSYAPFDFYKKNRYTIVEFEREKENTMSKLEIGSMVRVKDDYFVYSLLGKIGKVVARFKGGEDLTVQFEGMKGHPDLHDGSLLSDRKLDGKCDKRYISPKYLELVEKENNMKYELGDKVKVKSGLRKGQLLGITLDTYHKKLENNIFTIAGGTRSGRYTLNETEFILSDEMLEPVDEPNGYAIEDTPSPMKETFNIGDIVYDEGKRPLVIVRKAWVVCYQGQTEYEHFVDERFLSKTKPLQKITREELAKMGYELVD